MALWCRIEILPWGPLPAALHLPDALDAGHALGQLRLVDDAGPARRVDEAARLVAAVQVGGAAHVLAAVLRVDPPEVHRHVAKVVDRREAVLWGKDKCCFRDLP